MPLVTPPFNTANSVPGLYNFQNANTLYARAAIARAIDGVADAKIAFPGDSTMLGVGGANAFWGGKPHAWPRHLAKRLLGRGLNIEYGGSFGDGGGAQAGTPVQLGTVDPLWTLGAGWAASTTNTSLGGRCIENSTTTNALTYNPPTAFDSVDLYYVQNTSFGSFTVSIGGTVIQTVNSAGSSLLKKITVASGQAAAIQALAITPTTTGSMIRIIGVEPYNSSVKSIRLTNMGWSGSTSGPTSWGAKSVFSDPMWAIGTYSPNLIFLALGINEETVGTTNAAFESQMGSMITNCMNWSGGTKHADLILLTQNPVDTTVANGFPSAATQAAYRQSCLNLSNAYNVPLIDTWAFLGDWATRNTIGNINFDSDHLLGSGYAMIAGAVLEALAFCGVPT